MSTSGREGKREGVDVVEALGDSCCVGYRTRSALSRTCMDDPRCFCLCVSHREVGLKVVWTLPGGCVFFDVAVPLRGMSRRYGSGLARGYDAGYGSRASELLLCGFGHCKAPRWQLDSRENLDRLVATSQPGALVSGLN